MIDCLTSRPDGHAGQPRLPDRHRHAGGRQGGLHQGRRPVRGDGHRATSTPSSTSSKPELFERQMYEEFKDILGLSPEENQRAVEAGLSRARRLQQRHHARRRRARCWRSSSARTGSASCCWAGRTTTTRASTTRSWKSSRSSAIRCSRRTACRSTTTSSGGSSATRCAAGDIADPMAIADVWKNSLQREHQPQGLGREVRRRGIRTWWRWSCRASSAATTRRSTRWSRRSSSTPARRTSASRTSTRTSRPARSRSASRPSATS